MKIKDSIEEIGSEVIRIKRGETKLNKKIQELMNQSFKEIRKILEKYIDLKEEYYNLITTWIIGTYFHEKFSSYPYLFLNAMRGSGKTRTLKLIIVLSKKGNMMMAPTEAVLFRTTGTLGIDEFEGVANKDKSTVRELLNASYKKGTKVMRLKRKRTLTGEEQVVEEFETYRPIVLSNIYGMEEVLADRCISLILEKSNNPVKTRLIEDFENNENIQNIKKMLNQCSLCNVVMAENIGNEWNNYIINKNITTLTTYYTYNTQTTLTTQTHRKLLEKIKLDSIFNKIEATGIYGRHLELFLPLFLVSSYFGDFVFNNMLETSKMIINEKSSDEEIESRDVMVLDFISKQESGLIFHPVNKLTGEFKKFIGYEPEDNDNWLNSKWFGRSLKRLSLIIEKKRMAGGNEVMLNVAKSKEKLKMFKNDKM